MARKPRDYKAEYAAAKRRATAAGFESERDYKENFIRAQCAAWSDLHSHTPRSEYDEEWELERVRRYYRTFVDQRGYRAMSKKARAKEKRRRLKEWLVPDFMTETEWQQNYPPL